jgi:hypothetical protein
MVLGLVIGGIFERYLYISTSLYGAAWLLRPVVLCILVLVAWALFRPFAEIVRSIAGELRQIGKHPLRISASAAFTVAIIVFIIVAILLSNEWPAAAKPVPLTACYMALTAATLNLVNELFGKEQAVVAGVDGGVATGAHAGDDRLHPGDRRVHLRVHAFRLQGARGQLGRLCIGDGALVLGPVPQAARGGVAAVAVGRYLSGATRHPWFHLTGERHDRAL